MRKLIFLLLPLLLGACSNISSSYPEWALHKELSSSKRKKTEMEERIVALEIEIAKQEIASIRQLVEKFDQKKNINLSAPFSTQREKLASIIQNTPQCAVEAQGVLDQILALITQLSDAEKM